MEMNYCMVCGTRLHGKENETEGIVPWCDQCGQFRYPVFNTAVSMIVMDEAREHILLIRQYGRKHQVLVAGYVNQGEEAEHAAVREVREELNMTVTSLHFNHSHYFPPSNTLMLNFTVTVKEAQAQPNQEVDAWEWYSLEEAKSQVKSGSLAEAFLRGSLEGEYHFPF